MLKMNKYSLFFLVLLPLLVFGADEKKLALVRRIQGLEQLPPHLSRQLQTLTLQVVTKQPDYELLLSGTDSPNASVVELVAVESEVAKQGDYYRIEARLLNLKTKKLITRAARDDIREEDLIRLFQGALESLFVPDIEKEAAKEKPPVSPKEVSVPRQSPPPPSMQVKQPDLPTLDFKQRVRDLQIAADKAIVKTVEQKKEQADSKKNSPTVSLQASRHAGITSEMEVPFKKEPAPKIYPQRMVLMAGYDSRQVESDYYLITTTKAQLLTLQFAGDYPFSLMDGRIATSYELAYSRAVSAPVEVPSLYQLGLYASWLGTHWSTSLGLKRDASFFVNLPAPGEGIQSQSITTTWLNAKADLLFEMWGPWRINAMYGVPLQVETNYSPLVSAKQWQGTNIHLAITPPLNFKGWETNLSLDQINLTTQGERPFTLNESRIALSVRRSL
ncbi:MAG: hypothetical protein NDI69_08575 [Bacteriovoracaceae bacterium]|nr:hypothetical protein [Bacteriovoracaceae bacterium]